MVSWLRWDLPAGLFPNEFCSSECQNKTMCNGRHLNWTPRCRGWGLFFFFLPPEGDKKAENTHSNYDVITKFSSPVGVWVRCNNQQAEQHWPVCLHICRRGNCFFIFIFLSHKNRSFRQRSSDVRVRLCLQNHQLQWRTFAFLPCRGAVWTNPLSITAPLNTEWDFDVDN